MSNLIKKNWMRTFSFIVMVAVLVTTNIPIEAAAKKYVKGLTVAKTSVKLEEGKSIKVNATVKTVGSAKKTISAVCADAATTKLGALQRWALVCASALRCASY